jgi:hypothetical protein
MQQVHCCACNAELYHCSANYWLDLAKKLMDKNGGVTEQTFSLFDSQHGSAQTGYH